MRIFITGGCGFIGSHLVHYHLSKGDKVHVLDNLSSGILSNIEPFQQSSDFQFDQGDILTWKHLDKAVQAADRIYHLAAIVGMFNVIAHPVDVISTNIVGCRHLMQTIADANVKPTVLIASSSSVYGNNRKHLLNENDDLIMKPPSHPLATYAASKMANESIGLAYFKSASIPTVLVRLFNTIGPRQTGRYGMVVPRFIRQAYQDEPLTIYGDGHQTRSFCDVRDAVVALDLLAGCEKAIGEVTNVGNDREISINDLAKLVGVCTHRKIETNYISYKEAYGVDYTDITQRRPDLQKLRSLVDFKHQWTLEKTIEDLGSVVTHSD